MRYLDPGNTTQVEGDSVREVSDESAARQSDRRGITFDRWLAATGLVILAAVLVEQFELAEQHPMARQLMQSQDVPVLVPVAVALMLAAFLRLPPVPTRWMEMAESAGPFRLALVLFAATAIVALGSRFAAVAFAYSRDEAMAVFDAAILSSGRLLARIPPEWQAYAGAMQPEFRLPVPGDVAWVSSYLPVNAAIRAALGLVLGSPLVNAMLMLAALAGLLGVARRLWPRRPDAWTVAVLLLATSSQALFMAMTPYAMSAHLALNLVWLWLFLRDTRGSHAAAMLVGFFACGLHQVVFHPLFVAPFLLQAVLSRRWTVAGFYGAGYAAAGLFWILYWQLLLGWYGIEPPTGGAAGVGEFGGRVAALLGSFSFGGLDTIAQNMLRFAAWQNPMLIVLGAAGTVAIVRARDHTWPLVAGLALTLLAMFVLLPYQGTGWGYRYLHGLLGNAALVAAFGWMSLTDQVMKDERRSAWSVMAAGAVVSILILMPVHALQMRRTHEPYARAFAAIAGSRGEAVIVDSTEVFYGNDLVRNDPFLRNSPKVFDLGELKLEQVGELCSRYRVAVFGAREAKLFGIPATDPARHTEYDVFLRKKALMRSLDCGGEPLGNAS